MDKDAIIKSWLASMSESELIDQCFFWYDMAFKHGRAYNTIKAENEELQQELAIYKGSEQEEVIEYLRQENIDWESRYRALVSENAELRGIVAISIPLPLDSDCRVIHPDDVIGNNVNGKDFFGTVTKMHLTRYPRDGYPPNWVVETEDEDGKVTPYVCWGGHCNTVHREASQTHSAEFLKVYDENKQLKAENAELHELLDKYECENGGY